MAWFGPVGLAALDPPYDRMPLKAEFYYFGFP